jgi:hypothetical protein
LSIASTAAKLDDVELGEAHYVTTQQIQSLKLQGRPIEIWAKWLPVAIS